MKENMAGSLSKLLRRAVIAIVATGTVAAPAAYAWPSNNLIVVPPTDLPELARQTGEAMLLHGTIDGRTLLYIEQNQGARLAIFDVTDPRHMKGEGSVQLDAPGPFDFVSTLGSRAEVVRFREGQGSAVLDLHKASVPILSKFQAPTIRGTTLRLSDSRLAIASQTDSPTRSVPDFPMIDTESLGDLTQVF